MGVYSEICEFEMDFKKSLCLRFNLSNHDQEPITCHDIISA